MLQPWLCKENDHNCGYMLLSANLGQDGDQQQSGNGGIKHPPFPGHLLWKFTNSSSLESLFLSPWYLTHIITTNKSNECACSAEKGRKLTFVLSNNYNFANRPRMRRDAGWTKLKPPQLRVEWTGQVDLRSFTRNATRRSTSLQRYWSNKSCFWFVQTQPITRFKNRAGSQSTNDLNEVAHPAQSCKLKRRVVSGSRYEQTSPCSLFESPCSKY